MFDKDCIYIEGFKIAGYRSFGEEQTFGPFKKLNLFVGQNNCGKSNVLKLIKEDLRFLVSGITTRSGGHLSDNLKYLRKRSSRISFRIACSQKRWNFIDGLFAGDQRISALATSYLLEEPLAVNGLTYFPVVGRTNDLIEALDLLTQTCVLNAGAALGQLAPAWQAFRRIDYFDISNICGNFLLAMAQEAQRLTFPNVHYITHERMINRQVANYKGFPSDEWDGKATIIQLAMLQNPGSELSTSEELADMRRKFRRLTKFLQDVLENPTAGLQATFDKSTILVDLDERVDSLDSFGAGIHQLIMIAIATTYHDDQIFCIEEPETNMHPSLLKKLLKYLVDETTNQYFITTHSASAMDAVNDAAIFHLVHDGKQTIVTGVLNKKDQRQICEDLGFRASDLLQTNCMIWIEGPSDRIYISKLIAMLDNSLSEGKHYSFGFYGGACRAHLALSDDYGEDISNEIKDAWRDFVNLLSINKNAVMIADSDLSDQLAKQKDEDKIRLESDFKRHDPGSWYWQTQGREIENYVKEEVFERARNLNKPSKKEDKKVPFLNRKVTLTASDASIRKVVVARRVCEEKEPFNEKTDVIEKGKTLINKIRAWNGLKTKEWSLS